VTDPSGSQRISQRLGDVLLPDDVLKALWSPLEIQSPSSHLSLHDSIS
jgi:hypothetical protein